MITKLNALRKNKEEGFTLIELLVVILIIGVLSAIALPIFLNQTKAAKFASVKSDVKNTSTEAVLAAGRGNVSSAAIVKSTGNLVEIQPGANGAFVVCGAVDGDLANTWGFTSSTGIYAGGCTMSGQAPDPDTGCSTPYTGQDKAIIEAGVRNAVASMLSSAQGGTFGGVSVIDPTTCVSVGGQVARAGSVAVDIDAWSNISVAGESYSMYAQYSYPAFTVREAPSGSWR